MAEVRALLASYGGGHAQIMSEIAKALIERGDQPDVIGFTTAYRQIRCQGVPVSSVVKLIEAGTDREWLDVAATFTDGHSHPAVSLEETRAYFALGLRDLARKLGRQAALQKVETQGRMAFEPIESMRRYLRKTRPDIVITTTSPRFETALLKAARRESIPSIAIGDLFLVAERAWMLPTDYADHVAVLSQEVADGLIVHGFEPQRLHVTGNPAFDRLARIHTDIDRRNALRRELGIGDQTIILFPAPGGTTSKIGRSFLDIEDVVQHFEIFCVQNPNFSYLIRQHPNRPLDIQTKMTQGQLDSGELLSPEDALMVSDVVCVENSTLGLQAALAGKPTICIRFADQVQYPKFGLAAAVNSLDESTTLIKQGVVKLEGCFNTPPLGTATGNVLALIDRVLTQASTGS